jgi:hypothetical protein
MSLALLLPVGLARHRPTTVVLALLLDPGMAFR